MAYQTSGYVLTTPFGTYNLTPYVDLADASEITDSIERPWEMNSFTVGDVTLKLRDRTGTVKGYFAGLGPLSTDYILTINRGGNTVFSGIVMPETLEYDLWEGTVGFTAVGEAILLARTSAVNLFKRTPANWTLTVGAVKDVLAFAVSAPGNPTTCDFQNADEISLVTGTQEEHLQVTGVYPQPSIAPTSWLIRVAAPLRASYPAGTVVRLDSVYRRNVPLRTLVDGLFNAAGFAAPVGSNYSVTQIPIATDLFLAPINQSGIVGNITSVCPNVQIGSPAQFGRRIWVTTSDGVYEQASPPSGTWTRIASAPNQLLDPTNYRANITLFGERRKQTYTGGTWGTIMYFEWYAYVWTGTAPVYRYVLRIDIDEDNPAHDCAWAIRIDRQTYTAGTWAADVNVWAGDNGISANSELLELCLAGHFGIEYDATVDCLIFTDFTNASVVNAPVTYSISAYNIGGASVSRALIADRRGKLWASQPGRYTLWMLDSVNSNLPTAYVYTLTLPAGVLTVTQVGTFAIGGSFLPETYTWNEKDNRWYGLQQESDGVRLVTFGSDTSGPIALSSIPILPPIGSPDDLDLMVWHDPAGTTSYHPMIVRAGDALYYLSNSYAEVVAYADMEGMTCADALAQLSVLVGAYFYVDPFRRTFFRSRQIASQYSIGYVPVGPPQSDVIDDSQMLAGAKAQRVWSLTPFYVEVQSETSEWLLSYQGSPQFKDTSYALALKCRFVPNESYGRAIANLIFQYAGRGLRVYECEHYDDARRYTIGYTFRAILDGSLRTFQIIGVGVKLASNTTRVQGLEL